MKEEEVIDALTPGSELHKKVLNYLLDRLRFSERQMSKFYDRWSCREKEIQAYIDLPNYEKALKEMNKTGKPPVAVSLIIPYSYATINTIVTYLTHTFCGRSPMFTAGANSGEAIMQAPYIETLLQYNIDSQFLIKRYMQGFKDGEIYGLSVLKTMWEVRKRKRTQMQTTAVGEAIKVRKDVVVYEGNEVENVDPYLFFPDPRVPMAEVATKGQFCFLRDFVDYLDLKRDAADGLYKYIDRIGNPPATSNSDGRSGMSARSIRSGGSPTPGDSNDTRMKGMQFHQIDFGTCLCSPAELFDDPELPSRPEMWVFTIANKTQIIQAEPFEYDHGQHPVSVCEPQSIGYGFGQLSTADYLSPIQEAASWFLNSHMYNVRSALNNMMIVNPAMIEMKDLADPKPGKIIRMKRSALGQDPRFAVQQLQISDITRSHVEDLQGLLRMGDMLSSVTDNLRGIQDSGSRKTATEVRTAGEAGASRLAAQARLYSAMQMAPHASQMCMNNQQFLTKEYMLQVVGMEGAQTIGPDQISGEFFFPIHDGTLPQDKIAFFDLWQQILMGISQANPQQAAMGLAQYDYAKIFEYVAKLGGAQNISAFRIQPTIAPPGAEEGLAAAAQAGNVLPFDMKVLTQGLRT